MQQLHIELVLEVVHSRDTVKDNAAEIGQAVVNFLKESGLLVHRVSIGVKELIETNQTINVNMEEIRPDAQTYITNRLPAITGPALKALTGGIQLSKSGKPKVVNSVELLKPIVKQVQRGNIRYYWMCHECSKQFPASCILDKCDACGGTIIIAYDME